MRITKSVNFHKDGDCDFPNCYRVYCEKHRYLYNWCDGAERDSENDRKWYSDCNCLRCNLEIDRSIDADMEHQRHGV